MAVAIEQVMHREVGQPADTKSRWRPTEWALRLAIAVRQMFMTVRYRIAEGRADESGNVITDNLAWIVFGVIAIVAIGAAISGLGSDVLNWVKGQLGIGS